MNILLCFLHRLELTVYRSILLKIKNIFFLPVVCVCVVIPFILDVRFVDVPSGGHTGGRSHRISPPSFCGACLNFCREKDSAVPFFVDRESNLCLLAIESFFTCWALFLCFYLCFFVRKNSSCSCDNTEIRTHVPTSDGFEVNN